MRIEVENTVIRIHRCTDPSLCLFIVKIKQRCRGIPHSVWIWGVIGTNNPSLLKVWFPIFLRGTWMYELVSLLMYLGI